jgi:hypothetical protein
MANVCCTLDVPARVFRVEFETQPESPLTQAQLEAEVEDLNRVALGYVANLCAYNSSMARLYDSDQALIYVVMPGGFQKQRAVPASAWKRLLKEDDL